MNLYELSARYAQLLNREELSGEDLAEIESLNDSLEDKIIQLGKHLRNKEIELNAVSDSIKAMTARKGRIKMNIERIESLIIQLMELGNFKKITKDPLLNIQSIKNPPSIIVENEELIPNEYRREIIKIEQAIDKYRIKEDIQNGITVPGCSLKHKNHIKFS